MAHLGQRLRMAFLGFFNKPTETAILNKFNESFLWGSAGGQTTYDDKGITYIEKGYNINPIVYSIINQQAVKTSSIPFQVRKVENENAKKRLDALISVTGYNFTVEQKIKRSKLELKAFHADFLPFPLQKPNVNQTWPEFLALYKTFLKCTGNVYIYMLAPLEGQNAGVPIQVYLLPSHLVQIIIRPAVDLLGVENPVSGYILIEGRQYIEFEAKNVIHIKYSNPNYDQSGGHLYGMSPLRSALRNIISSNTALDLNIKTLKSGGAFGFIHAKQTPLRVEQASEIKERLLEMNSSPEDLSKIAGISAEIGFTRISLTTDELKPFDYLSFDEKQIANVLGWSDKLLNNDSASTFDNINQERKRVVTDNIIPDLNLLSDALNAEFLPRFKGYDKAFIEFDFMELPEMQDDIQTLTKSLNDHLDRGVMNRDEYRLSIRMEPLGTPEMQVFTVKDDVLPLVEAVSPDFNIDNG